jgi:predicted kinase
MEPAVLETHTAVLFFVDDRVYKLKKPVDLGFLNFRRRVDREAVCHREVELNRRPAPDVYLGVADIHGPDGRPCDHLVVMRRLPAERRLATPPSWRWTSNTSARPTSRGPSSAGTPSSAATAHRPALQHHYIAYRAYVRAKVGCLRYAQGDIGAASDVPAYTDLALRHLRAGAVRLVLIGGPPATGKTTLAGHLADTLGAVVLSSDHVRKELAGMPAGTSAACGYRQGIYAPAWTERTYAELLRRARRLLERGETVVLDASWTRAGHRRAARILGAETHSTVVELRCVAGAATMINRLAHRTGDASDADASIAAAMSTEADPWPQAHPIITDRTPDRSRDRALAVITGSTQQPGGCDEQKVVA